MAACKRTQQLPIFLRQQCSELLRACWQWCANGCNNSQQCWDLQCIVGRIQPISQADLWAVQMDPTLLCHASAITEQKKCWDFLLGEKFDRFQTLRNNTQQHPTTCNRVCKRTQHVTSNNVASVCTGLMNGTRRPSWVGHFVFLLICFCYLVKSMIKDFTFIY